ncbi:hypothetical protein [Belnapia rosea]|uniref:hypothetical protein n=1 Tax=Belnapia rosea TaxID=938405 RepID=UPI00088D16CA|nr:hypothetical protein [Belnapia rosea]SDB67089.1 hypothetical protein SAMN02927895_03012 [Belnapia rosea]
MVDTATAPLAQRSPLRPRFLYQPVRPCGPQEQDQDGHGPLIIGFRIDAGATGDGITADAASLLQGTATPGTLARLILGTGQTGIALGRLLGGGVVTNRVGNAAANAVTGNEAANLLSGGASADTLEGAGGNDVLFCGLLAATASLSRAPPRRRSRPAIFSSPEAMMV